MQLFQFEVCISISGSSHLPDIEVKHQLIFLNVWLRAPRLSKSSSHCTLVVIYLNHFFQCFAFTHLFTLQCLYSGDRVFGLSVRGVLQFRCHGLSVFQPKDRDFSSVMAYCCILTLAQGGCHSFAELCENLYCVNPLHYVFLTDKQLLV